MSQEVTLLQYGPVREMLKRLLHVIETGVVEDFLDVLLQAMHLAFKFDHNYRKNIEGFNASYYFTGENGRINVTATFADGKMTVHKEICEHPTLTVEFKDSNALVRFLRSSGQDLLTPILHQDVVTKGNLNYLSKFGYMSKHLQLLIKHHEEAINL